LAALLLVGSGVAGATTRGAEDERMQQSRSRAIGSATDGRLEHGMFMRETRDLYFKYGSPEEERWGTEELVGMLRRSAGAVARQLPGAQLTVGDLSREHGGPMRPHLSHANGRDVDVGFYLTDGDGEAKRARRFVRVRRNGRGFGGTRFDDRRNWKLVESMLSDSRAQVEAILVASHLERRLLAEARRQGASRWLYERARLVMYQPRVGGRHDDHFHVRIHCPPDDEPACEDGEPAFPVMGPFTTIR